MDSSGTKGLPDQRVIEKLADESLHVETSVHRGIKNVGVGLTQCTMYSLYQCLCSVKGASK